MRLAQTTTTQVVTGYSTSISWRIECWGLKPSTNHTLFIEGEVYDPAYHGLIGVSPGAVSGSLVQTDASGKVTINFYPSATFSQLTNAGPTFNLAAPGSTCSGFFSKYVLTTGLSGAAGRSTTIQSGGVSFI